MTLIPCIYAIGVPTPIVYHTQVWGIVSFVFFGFYHNLLVDERNQLHTFFL